MICEGTNSSDDRVREASFECFVKIASSYYDKLPPYIETIFQLTSSAVTSDKEDVAKQAIEFWCSICEEETAIQEVRRLTSVRLALPSLAMHLLCTSVAVTCHLMNYFTVAAYKQQSLNWLLAGMC